MFSGINFISDFSSFTSVKIFGVAQERTGDPHDLFPCSNTAYDPRGYAGHHAYALSPVPAVPQQQQNAKVYSLSRKSAALCGDGHAGCLLPAQRILYHSAFRRAGSACVGLRGGPAPLEEEYAFKHWSRYDPLYGAHPVRLYMNRAASDAVKTAPPVLCESTPAQCKSAALPARAIAVSAHLAERPAKRKSTTRKSL